MKPKFLAFPLLALAFSPTVMGGQFIWTGASNSTWTTASNWDIISSPPVSPNTHPVPGTTYPSDFLNIRNNGDLLTSLSGVTPGADVVYNPGAGVTTTFNNGRCFVIGTGAGPTATLPNLPNRKGYAKLTVASGTLVGARSSNSGSEAYMANRADSTLVINGGSVDLSQQLNNFRLIHEGFTDVNGPITSTITIDSGSLSCRALDLVFDTELDPATVFGNGIVNLNGGTFTLTRFVRTAASDPGQTSFTLNLNGGTLRPLVSLTSPAIFLDALTDLKTVVKAGGAIFHSSNPATPTTAIAMTIAEVLEHDPSGPAIDGGLTKNGPGNLTLSGTNTFTGPVTVNAGTLAAPSRLLLSNNSGAGTGAITLADSYADIQVNNTRNIANAITISNTGDDKTLLLPSPGGGNFAGATFSGDITINETNIDHFRVRADTNCFLTLSGMISGPGGISKIQTGTVTLSNAANDFTGVAKITQGGLSFANGALGTGGSILMDGGTLTWSAGNPEDISSRLVMVSGKTATLNLAEQTTPSYAISNVTFASAIGNGTTAALVKTGPGALILTQPSTYSGGSTLTQGTLEFPNNGLGGTGSVTMNGAILRWATGNTQDLSSRMVMVNGRTASFSTNGNDVTFANAIGGSTSGNLTKTNTAGTLALMGANTYSGTTTVGGGTLKIGNFTSLGVFGPQTTATPLTTVAGGATLDLNGNLGVNEAISINGSGVGGAGALVNHSATAASIGKEIVGLTVPATGSGSGFSTAPAVVISGTGTGATATASLGVTTESFELNVSGDREYTVAPTVTIGGGGTGATATAVLSEGTTGTVIGITVTSAGSGFTTSPTAVISGGTSTGTSVSSFTGNDINFTVGGLTLTNAGSGYTGTPTVTFDGSPATVATTYSSVTLAANSSIGGTGNTTIDGVVSESGGSRALTKVAAGTVTLNGANTYTGETLVDGGTLSISTDDTLANAAAVRIADGTFLNLNFAGTDTVDRLYLAGVEQASGTWGSLASGATHETARITGTGILDVTNGAVAANDYASWASSQVPPVTGGPNGDSDNDGVPNLVEYALTDGEERGVLSGNTIIFTKRGVPYGSDITYDIESSTLLTTGSWTTLA